MIKKTLFLLVILMSASLNSQHNVFDNHQYIVVADKFDFLKEVDKYKTSSLTKFLLKKKGFKVYLSNELLPNELNTNRCLGLFASVKDEASVFTTKSTIVIKDCYGKILYTSKVGKSKLKEYQKAYHEAIRNAFESMEDFEYSYTKNSAKNISDDVILNTLETPKEIVLTNSNAKVEKCIQPLVTLYAQAIENGFQLVNTKPEVVFKILKTNKKDKFVIKDKNGNFYKKGAIWIAEYYEDNKLVKKEYQVKF